MVYFATGLDPYTYPVKTELLDVSAEDPFGGVTYEADPDRLDLTAVERELFAKGRSAMGNGYRVEGSRLPKKMLWEDESKILPEAIMKNFLAVSSRFRDLVENFEPNMHQFFPVEIYRAPQGSVSETYYWINVCNRIDSINTEETTYKWTLDYTGKHGFWDDYDVKNAKLIFARRKSAHIIFGWIRTFW